jgi:hypothetical protein
MTFSLRWRVMVGTRIHSHWLKMTRVVYWVAVQVMIKVYHSIRFLRSVFRHFLFWNTILFAFSSKHFSISFILSCISLRWSHFILISMFHVCLGPVIAWLWVRRPFIIQFGDNDNRSLNHIAHSIFLYQSISKCVLKEWKRMGVLVWTRLFRKKRTSISKTWIVFVSVIIVGRPSRNFVWIVNMYENLHPSILITGTCLICFMCFCTYSLTCVSTSLKFIVSDEFYASMLRFM